MASVPLPGSPVTACVGTADGGCVLGTSAPPGIVFIANDGSVAAASRIDERAEQPLAVGSDGRVFVVTRSATVLVVAPDATVRGVVHLPAGAVSTPAVLDDGTVLVFGSSVRGGSFAHVIEPRGGTSRSVSLRVNALGNPVAWRDRAVAPTATGLVMVGSDGSAERLPVASGILAMDVHPDGGIVVAGIEGLARLDRRARVVATRPAPSVEWVACAGSDAIWTLRSGASSRIVCHGADLVERWSLPIPSSAAQPSIDEGGAALLCCRDGTMIAVETDGSERWRLTAGDALLGGAVRLGGGRIAVAGVHAGLLLLHGST